MWKSIFYHKIMNLKVVIINEPISNLTKIKQEYMLLTIQRKTSSRAEVDNFIHVQIGLQVDISKQFKIMK